MTHQVGKAQEILHEEHQYTIIKTFRQTGISLNPNGSKDTELKIRDLPGIKVRDQTRSDLIISGKNPNSCGNTS